jgi:deoxyadenosine/deoxycytidine kinase
MFMWLLALSASRSAIRPVVQSPSIRRALATCSEGGSSAGRKIISLEGNIGAGKSTLLRGLQRHGVRTIEEPLAQWQGTGQRQNLLDLFYTDPKRWAFTFQTFAFLSRAQASTAALKAAPEGEATVVLERSLQSDKRCFAINCHKTGLFTEAEWAVYSDYHDWLVGESASLRIDGAVYLRTSPTTCLGRIRQRARAEESSLPLEYLTQLHARHEEWLLPGGEPAPPGELVSSRTSPRSQSRTSPRSQPGELVSSDGVPVLVVDWDGDCAEGSAGQMAAVEAICQFSQRLADRE